jgi:hypothetical protein
MSVYPQYNNNNLKKWGQVPVAHTHNSSCSGGRGQEDSRYIVPEDSIKKTITKKGWWRNSSSKSTCLASMRL